MGKKYIKMKRLTLYYKSLNSDIDSRSIGFEISAILKIQL